MRVYIDKKNALSLAESKRQGADLYDNCMRMLKFHGDLYFQFPKGDIKEMPTVMDWIKILTDGIRGDIGWGQPIYPQPRPLKANIHKQLHGFSDLSAVYLLDDEKAENVSKLGLLTMAPVGKELQVLSKLILTNDGQYTRTFTPSKMKGWNEIEPCISPLTDIILVDQYILSSPDVYEPNLYTLIEQICSVVQGGQVNIVIFTLPNNYNKSTQTTFTPEFDKIIKEIKQRTQNITRIKANITFVLSSELEEHDRTLFTNMKFYVSGDSFNYFDSQNRIITNGRYLHIHSLGSKENYELGMQFVSDMQNIIINTESKNNPDLFKGNKECNYLHFS